MTLDNIPGTKLFRQRDVRETPAPTQTQTQTNVAPIGAIFPWLKSFTNTPALISGWVECNGQTLSDAESVYNGQVIPDLNGDNRFLRGNSTSGGTGGSETMAHTHTKSVMGSASNDQQVASGTGVFVAAVTHEHTFTTSAASNTENRPPFYNIVWIMRIK